MTLTDVANGLAVVAFFGAWAYCAAKNVDPLMLAARFTQRVGDRLTGRG